MQVTGFRVAIVVVIAALSAGWYGISQVRQEVAAKKASEKIKADRVAEENRIDREKRQETAIRNADRLQIVTLVERCKQNIKSDLAAGNPFEVYFPAYSPDRLRKIGDLAAASGIAMGRPSAALNDTNFDPVTWNVMRIRQNEHPARSVEFAVEHAVDGLSVRRYAATYRCYLTGASVGKAYQDKMYFMD